MSYEETNGPEIFIKKSNLEILKNNIVFIDILDMARARNALSFHNEITKDYPGNTLVEIRQRFRSFFYLSGALNQAYKKIRELENKYGEKREFKSEAFINGFSKFLADETVAKFFDKKTGIIRSIRDKTAFHFDEDVIKDTLRKEDALKWEKFIFAKADRETPDDMYFVLADEIEFNYHLSVTEENKSMTQANEVFKNISDITDRYLIASNEFMTEQIDKLIESKLLESK